MCTWTLWTYFKTTQITVCLLKLQLGTYNRNKIGNCESALCWCCYTIQNSTYPKFFWNFLLTRLYPVTSCNNRWCWSMKMFLIWYFHISLYLDLSEVLEFRAFLGNYFKWRSQYSTWVRSSVSGSLVRKSTALFRKITFIYFEI